PHIPHIVPSPYTTLIRTRVPSGPHAVLRQGCGCRKISTSIRLLHLPERRTDRLGPVTRRMPPCRLTLPRQERKVRRTSVSTGNRSEEHTSELQSPYDLV